MDRHRFKFRVPVITILIAILVPLVSIAYANLPKPLQSPLTLFLTSPFNITYEVQNGGVLFNYVLLLVIYLFVEIYSRNIADLRGRASLIRNAALLSVLSAYIASAIIWFLQGFPSSGTSILAFNILIFAGFETYDSELIKRMSDNKATLGRWIEMSSVAFVVLVIIASMLLYMYLNANQSWYVHIMGGIIFAPIYYVYLMRSVRPRVDRFEEKIERDVERDVGIVEADVEKELKEI